MKITRANFDQLIQEALANPDVALMRPVIEKELLHYDILFALDQGGLLNQLVFQGGTSLRLCYGANRFSEGLDFAGGKDFSAKNLADIKNCIKDYISRRYDLTVTMKEPKELRLDPHYSELKIDKWQVSVVTAPQRKDLPHQRIKLEIANIPAYTKQPMALVTNYDFLPDGYGDTLILTETLNEIMADKIIALPATTKYIRYRDIWDLVWLTQQGAKLDMELVMQKADDYRLESYELMVHTLLKKLPQLIVSKQFTAEMRRFIPIDVLSRTLDQEKFRAYLTNTLQQLFQRVADNLTGEMREPDFMM